MRFAEVLPHLEAGRRVRRRSWNPVAAFGVGYAPLDCRDILASDWEVVEEPAPAKPAPVPTCSSCGEHPSAVYCKKRCPHDAQPACKQCDLLAFQVARLTRERDGLKGAYDELRAVAENNAAILDKVDAIVRAHS